MLVQFCFPLFCTSILSIYSISPSTLGLSVAKLAVTRVPNACCREKRLHLSNYSPKRWHPIPSFPREKRVRFPIIPLSGTYYDTIMYRTFLMFTIHPVLKKTLSSPTLVYIYILTCIYPCIHLFFMVNGHEPRHHNPTRRDSFLGVVQRRQARQQGSRGGEGVIEKAAGR